MHRLDDALHLRDPCGLEGKMPFCQLVGGLARHDRTPAGQALQTGGQAGRVPDGYIVGVQVVGADRAHYDLAAIDAHANFQVDTTLPQQCVGVLSGRLLHAQRRIQGAVGMIFMGDGGAKEGEDAIAKRLGHIALVAMDCFHHQL